MPRFKLGDSDMAALIGYLKYAPGGPARRNRYGVAFRHRHYNRKRIR